MKQNIKILCGLLLILIITSTIVIFSFGNICYLKYINSGKNIQDVIVDNETGEVEILDRYEKNGKYVVKVKAKKPGKSYIRIDNGDYEEGKVVYIHKSMIITDNNYFGKSTGSEVIPISITILLAYILYILINKYIHSKKDNMYQYKNIAYLGIIIFVSFFAVSNFLSIFSYYGLYDTITKMIDSLSLVSIILFPFALITSLLVTISNIVLIRKEGRTLKNLLGLFLGIFICVFSLLPNFVYGILMKSQVVNIYNLNGPGPYIYNFIESLVYLGITYLECILIGTIIVAIMSVKKRISYDKDYMIILGCQIKKDGSLTPLLKGRVDRALSFRNEQLEKTGKDLIFVPSGGRGKDEIISEAEAMKKYLIENGIDKKNILIEDKSRNTYENISFSNKLITKKNANVGFSTTNYHVLRAGLIATEQGLKLEGIGSKTKMYFWINAFIREFIGTLYSERKKHIIVFLLLVVMIIMMVLVTYFANNI